jgi:hypothetical protein
LRVVPGNKRDDLPQIVLRLRREDYFAAHESTSFRASSAGMPSPWRACSRAA